MYTNYFIIDCEIIRPILITQMFLLLKNRLLQISKIHNDATRRRLFRSLPEAAIHYTRLHAVPRREFIHATAFSPLFRTSAISIFFLSRGFSPLAARPSPRESMKGVEAVFKRGPISSPRNFHFRARNRDSCSLLFPADTVGKQSSSPAVVSGKTIGH